MKVHAAIVAALVLGLARLGYTAQLNADSENFIRDTADFTGDLLGFLSRFRVDPRSGDLFQDFIKILF